MKFAIIADDLTSATDVGIQFTRVGYQVGITWRMRRDPGNGLKDIDVLSIDCDSRTQSATEARKRARDAARCVLNAEVIFKSIDSTVRGHIAAELSGVLDATGRQTAIVAPAFPLAGRTTCDGVQLLNGQPLHRTEFARDPINPVQESRISELLVDPGLHPIMVLDRLQAGNPHEMGHAMRVARCVVADADSDEDLQRIVRAVVDPTTVCWVGSPGLARALGEVFPAKSRTNTKVSPSQNLLVVIGSLNSVSRRQLSRLLAMPLCDAVELDSKCVLEGNRQGAIHNAVRSAQDALRPGRLVALFSNHRPASTSHAGDADVMESGPRAIAACLAEVVYELVREGAASGLVLVGGDTASVILRRLDVLGVRLHAELEPGIPMGQLIGSHPLRIVTKAGGFGSDEILIQACSALRA